MTRTFMHTALAFGLGLCLTVPSAQAKSKKKAKYERIRLQNLDARFQGLKLGGDEKAAMLWVQMRFQHHYDPKIAKATGVDKQRWKDKVVQDAKAAQKAAVDYKGGKHGFEASIIANDFGRVPGERLIVAKVGQVKHYLMFYEGKLWRYAVSVKAKRSFKERVAEYTNKVGKPVVERSTPRSFAGWIFKEVRVELRDQRVMYNGDTLILTHRGIGSKVAKLAKKHAKTKKSDTAGLDDVLAKPDESDPDTSAADKELKEYNKKYGKKKKKKKRRK